MYLREFYILQVALKLHALDVRGLLRSQWQLRSSLIGILEMGGQFEAF